MPTYAPHHCPISKFATILGDGWTWLILREAFIGITRFSDFQSKTGIAKNILSTRMNRLVDSGIFRREDVGKAGPRYEYFLTEKGQSLKPLMADILDWSETHLKEGQ